MQPDSFFRTAYLGRKDISDECDLDEEYVPVHDKVKLGGQAQAPSFFALGNIGEPLRVWGEDEENEDIDDLVDTELDDDILHTITA